MLLFFLLKISIVTGVFCNLYIPDIERVNTSVAFHIPIDHKWFPDFVQGDQLEYSVSLLDMPDLPHWMFCHLPANES
ncbi:hypothetical protein X975_01750, partial [Stegodyphus mimosarum]